MSPQQGAAPASNVVGRRTNRIDAYERVTGRATYTRDVRVPGMLYGRVLRSPHPHARVVSIDTSRALALPGVRAVITDDNAHVVYHSGSISGGSQYNDEAKRNTIHRRYIFGNPVRFVGQPVAAVAAVDRHTAEAAVELIEVEYEPLPFVLDPEEALQPDAPQIWPEGNLCPDRLNNVTPRVSRRGDIDGGFRDADLIFEDRFTTAYVHDAQMEPRSCLGYWEGDKLTLHTMTQGISNCRHDTATDLGIPDHQVRIICQYLGGGFGDKNGNYDTDIITAMLAREAQAPVMLELSRKEDWIGTHGRWGTVQYYRVGVKRDGTVTAIQLRNYSDMGPFLRRGGGIGGMEAYGCPNKETIHRPVYTNRAVAGNFRAPGDPQGYFGIQSIMDDIAYAVGMDPVQFALRNAQFPTEDVQFTNHTLAQCIERGVELFDWPSRWRRVPGSDSGPVKRGAGMSFMMFRSLVGASSAILRVDSLGRYTLFVGVTDVGGGAKTTLGMVAAEALGVPLTDVDVVWGDTDRTPYSVGESGSRTTTMTGYAVIQAAEDLKRQIAENGMPQGNEVRIASATPTPTTEGKRRDCFGAHFCEVEVDTRVGDVRILKYTTVHESGRIINPITAKDQIRGATLQGISQALHEDLLYDANNGQPLTAGYYGGRHITHVDAPEIEVTFIESDDGYGAFGNKTVGEAGIIPSPAAVANAVYNAIGVRIKDMPITREKIIGALG